MQTFTSSTSSLDAVHRDRVMDELRSLGISRIGLSRFDVRYLPDIIHPTEHLKGVVYGYGGGESVLIAATDQRFIFLSKKPLYVSQDDISYGVVSGITFTHVGFGSTVSLHTRTQDYAVHTYNRRTARQFVKFVELVCMQPRRDRIRT